MCHTTQKGEQGLHTSHTWTRPGTACTPPVLLGPKRNTTARLYTKWDASDRVLDSLTGDGVISTGSAPNFPDFVTKTRLRLLVDSGTTVALSLATHFSSWRPGPALPCQPRCLNSLPALSLTSVAVPTNRVFQLPR